MYSALEREEARQQTVRVSSGIHERMELGNTSERVRPILGYRKDSFDRIYIYKPEAIVREYPKCCVFDLIRLRSVYPGGMDPWGSRRARKKQDSCYGVFVYKT